MRPSDEGARADHPIRSTDMGLGARGEGLINQRADREPELAARIRELRDAVPVGCEALLRARLCARQPFARAVGAEVQGAVALRCEAAWVACAGEAPLPVVRVRLEAS